MSEQTASPQHSGWTWVWRGSIVGTRAHLIPAHKVETANPMALCGARIRKPVRRWQDVCSKCSTRAEGHHEPTEELPSRNLS